MQRLEVSGAVRPIYGSLGVKRLTNLMQKSCFIISELYSSTCFEHYVLIIRRSKLYRVMCEPFCHTTDINTVV